MTCIVGLVDKETVWIGGDSAATADSTSRQDILEEDHKVFFVNAPESIGYRPAAPTLLIGGTTSYRFLNVLQYKLVVPSYDPLLTPKAYLVTHFIDAVREALKSAGYDKKESGEEQGGDFLVGWQGKLYRIEDGYQVSQASRGYTAIGGTSGHVALGVFYATQGQDMPPEPRVRLALEASSYYSCFVRPPFCIEKI